MGLVVTPEIALPSQRPGPPLIKDESIRYLHEDCGTVEERVRPLQKFSVLGVLVVDSMDPRTESGL